LIAKIYRLENQIFLPRLNSFKPIFKISPNTVKKCLGTFPKSFSQAVTSQICPCRSARPPSLRRPHQTFGKLPLGKFQICEVATWEIVTWEVDVGKMFFETPLGKMPLEKCHW